MSEAGGVEAHMMKEDMTIVVGTYDRTLYGLECNMNTASSSQSISTNQGPLFRGRGLATSFIHSAHTGCVKAVAVDVHGRYLASGSTDEGIMLFDLVKRIELGTLFKHQGTILSLRFYESSHLFSTSQDGSICIWQQPAWDCVRELKGHKGPVDDIALHPSGKVALSVSTDRTLRAWNLVSGRSLYVSNLQRAAHLVEFSPVGDYYVTATGNKYITCTETDGSAKDAVTVDFGSRICSLKFISDHQLAVGGEGSHIVVFAVPQLEILYRIQAHSKRVRSLAVLPRASSEGSDDEAAENVLVSASSDSTVKVWKLPLTSTEDIGPDQCVATIDLEETLTTVCCVRTDKDWKPSVVNSAAPTKRQRSTKEQEDDDNSEEEEDKKEKEGERAVGKSNHKRTKNDTSSTVKVSKSTPPVAVASKKKQKTKGKNKGR